MSSHSLAKLQRSDSTVTPESDGMAPREMHGRVRGCFARSLQDSPREIEIHG
jgi:hypothetical protein